MSKRRGVRFLIAFVDVLLAFVTIYMALNTIEMIAMNPQEVNKGNITSDAQAMIELSWNQDCDFDLWIKDPNNNIVYFLQADLGGGHLERDSMGSINNYVTGIGTPAASHYKEVWFMREIIPGTYRANIHLYSCKPKDSNRQRTDPNTQVDDTTVSITVTRLNPSYSLIFEKEEHFSRTWEERPEVKFDVDSNGNFSNVGPNDELWVDDNIKFGVAR